MIYIFCCFSVLRSNPNKVNEAILVFGDVQGHVNALLFSAATMALFDRPAQPAGSKQGADPIAKTSQYNYFLLGFDSQA